MGAVSREPQPAVLAGEGGEKVGEEPSWGWAGFPGPLVAHGLPSAHCCAFFKGVWIGGCFFACLFVDIIASSKN